MPFYSHLAALEKFLAQLSIFLLKAAVHLRNKICCVRAGISTPFYCLFVKKSNGYEMNGCQSRDLDKGPSFIIIRLLNLACCSGDFSSARWNFICSNSKGFSVEGNECFVYQPSGSRQREAMAWVTECRLFVNSVFNVTLVRTSGIKASGSYAETFGEENQL